jgi:hypothetical protein
MLIPQQAQCEMVGRQGCRPVTFDELRRQLATPSESSEGHRQRLLDLARRLARVQALGDEYNRVAFSPAAESLAGDRAAV